MARNKKNQHLNPAATVGAKYFTFLGGGILPSILQNGERYLFVLQKLHILQCYALYNIVQNSMNIKL